MRNVHPDAPTEPQNSRWSGYGFRRPTHKQSIFESRLLVDYRLGLSSSILGGWNGFLKTLKNN